MEMLHLCHRFKDRFSKQNPRKIIHMWAEKELHNLVEFDTILIKNPNFHDHVNR